MAIQYTVYTVYYTLYTVYTVQGSIPFLEYDNKLKLKPKKINYIKKIIQFTKLIR